MCVFILTPCSMYGCDFKHRRVDQSIFCCLTAYLCVVSYTIGNILASCVFQISICCPNAILMFYNYITMKYSISGFTTYWKRTICMPDKLVFVSHSILWTLNILTEMREFKDQSTSNKISIATINACAWKIKKERYLAEFDSDNDKKRDYVFPAPAPAHRLYHRS